MLGCLCTRALCSPCTQVARRTLHSVPHQRRGVPLPRLLTRIHPPARAAASRPSSELPKASRHRFPCSRPSRRAAEGTEDVTSTRRRRARTSEAEGARGVPGAAQRSAATSARARVCAAREGRGAREAASVRAHLAEPDVVGLVREVEVLVVAVVAVAGRGGLGVVSEVERAVLFLEGFGELVGRERHGRRGERERPAGSWSQQ